MRVLLTFLIALVGLGISMFNASVNRCTCGYLDFGSLPGSLIGAGMAWCAWFIWKDVKGIEREVIGFAGRVVIGFACVITTVILLKNICFILWYGHDPILG
jgi:hypothetical protein